MQHRSPVGAKTDCVTNTCYVALSRFKTNAPFVVMQMQHFIDILFTVLLGSVIELFCVVDYLFLWLGYQCRDGGTNVSISIYTVGGLAITSLSTVVSYNTIVINTYLFKVLKNIFVVFLNCFAFAILFFVISVLDTQHLGCIASLSVIV